MRIGSWLPHIFYEVFTYGGMQIIAVTYLMNLAG